jgi:hypothetical protein
VEASCIPARADVTGELSSGYLVLSGQMFSTRCLASLGEDGYFRYVLDDRDHLKFEREYTLAPDIPLHEAHQATVAPGLELHCLAIALINEPSLGRDRINISWSWRDQKLRAMPMNVLVC